MNTNVTDYTIGECYKAALHASRELEECQAATRSARGVLGAVLKEAKKLGVSIPAVKRVLKDRKLDLAEVVNEERQYLRVMTISGVMPTIQESLFGDLSIPAAEEDTEDRAYDVGVQCGQAGETRTINPYNAGSGNFEAWDRGWRNGQESIAAKLGKGKRAKKDNVVAMKSTPTLPPPQPEQEDDGGLYDQGA